MLDHLILAIGSRDTLEPGHAHFGQVSESLYRKPSILDKSYPIDAEVRLVSVKVWETASSWAEFH